MVENIYFSFIYARFFIFGGDLEAIYGGLFKDRFFKKQLKICLSLDWGLFNSKQTRSLPFSLQAENQPQSDLKRPGKIKKGVEAKKKEGISKTFQRR